MRCWRWPAVIIVVLALTAVTTTRSSDMRSTMRGLYEALTWVLLTSVDETAFQDPANQEQILMQLRQLSSNANRLERHAYDLGDSYDYLRRSLARDSRDAAKRFEAGEYVAARFVIHKLTENCMACHTREAAATEFELAKDFIQDPRVASLPLEDRLRLEIATRQFESAMETSEAILASKRMIADQIVVTGVFEDYLELTLRVGHDCDRLAATLRAFSLRRDVPSYLNDVIEVWLEALDRLDLGVAAGRELPVARNLIEKARRVNRFPADRRGLVDFVAASALLHDFLSAGGPDDALRSEAYYLLGFAESHMARSYWLSETDFFLERAIRLAPGSPSAREAYLLLEAVTVTSFSGSGGVDIPPDIRKHLDELKELVD